MSTYSPETTQGDQEPIVRIFNSLTAQFDGPDLRGVEITPDTVVLEAYNPNAAGIQALSKEIQKVFSNDLYDWDTLIANTRENFREPYEAAVAALSDSTILEQRPALYLLFADLGDLAGIEQGAAPTDYLTSREFLDVASKDDLKAIIYNIVIKGGDISDIHLYLKKLLKSFRNVIESTRADAPTGNPALAINRIQAQVTLLGDSTNIPAIEGAAAVVVADPGGGFDFLAATAPRAAFLGDHGIVSPAEYRTRARVGAAPLLKLLGKDIALFTKFNNAHATASKQVWKASTTQELKAVYYHLTSDQVIFDGNEELREFISELGEKITARGGTNDADGPLEMMEQVAAKGVARGL